MLKHSATGKMEGNEAVTLWGVPLVRGARSRSSGVRDRRLGRRENGLRVFSEGWSGGITSGPWGSKPSNYFSVSSAVGLLWLLCYIQVSKLVDASETMCGGVRRQKRKQILFCSPLSSRGSQKRGFCDKLFLFARSPNAHWESVSGCVTGEAPLLPFSSLKH